MGFKLIFLVSFFVFSEKCITFVPANLNIEKPYNTKTNL